MSEKPPIPFPILATDYLLENSPEYKVYNPSLVLQNFVSDTNTDITKEQEINIRLNGFKEIIEFAETKGYIYHPSNNSSQSMFALTDLGRAVKLKGGHFKYWDYIEKRDNAVFESLEYSKRSAEAAEKTAYSTKTSTLFIIIYTAITAIIAGATIKTCSYSQPNLKSSQQQIKQVSITEININNEIEMW